MRNLRQHAAILVATATLLVACADSSSEPEPGADAMTSSAPDESATTSTSPDERASRPAVAAAMADLATRRSVNPDDVTITELAEVTWRDGSLGCPQPGMQYSQALVEGQQLILSLASDPTQSFAYHSGSRGEFTFCASPQPPVQGAPAST